MLLRAIEPWNPQTLGGDDGGVEVRAISVDHTPVHHPPLRKVIGKCAVHRRSLVPDGEVSGPPLPPAVEVRVVDVPAKEAIPASPSRRRKRSVDPNTSLSHKYNEKKNMQAFFKILAATVVVFIIAAAVYYFLKNPPS